MLEIYLFVIIYDFFYQGKKLLELEKILLNLATKLEPGVIS